MFAVERILVPVDFSDTSRAAISAALQIASDNGAELYLLHTERGMSEDAKQASPDQVKDLLATVDVDEAALNEAVELERSRVIESGKALGDVVIKTRVSGGNWVQVAHLMVDEEQIDLIVTATHGRHGLLEQIRGSDTERLVAKATCSVFVVKPKGFPYLRD
jgi:nucleotide-binding universal stress UspA family protein